MRRRAAGRLRTALTGRVPDLADNVQLQVSSLLVDDEGRLTERIQAGRALRCAVLADLVTAGALRNTRDSIEIEPVPHLLPLAERVLADMTAKPDEDLVWWAHHDAVSVHDAAQQMVELGLWQRHEVEVVLGLGIGHRWTWREDAADVRRQLQSAVGTSWEQADRTRLAPTLALVGGLWGHPPRLPDDDVVAALGATNWLVPDLVDYLWRSAAQLRLVSFGGT